MLKLLAVTTDHRAVLAAVAARHGGAGAIPRILPGALGAVVLVGGLVAQRR